MAKLLKLRRGTTTQHGSFTGAEGEVTIDTDKDTAVVHDGQLAGGRPLAREDLNNVSSSTIAGRLSNDSIAPAKIGAGTLPSDVTVASANLVDGTIVNADIASNAAIAGTKLENSGVTAGSYGSSSAIPIVTVDAQGLVTAASTTAIDSTTIANGTSNVAVANNGNITATRSGTARLVVDDAGVDVTGALTVSTSATVSQLLNANGGLTIENSDPRINLVDTDGNPDYHIRNNGGSLIIRNTTNGVNNFVINGAGEISTGSNVDVTGNITVSGTVDGRDVNTDGGKLDSIETGAEVNPTNAETKTAYEANSNTNAFTDALLSKLNGIAASATNVTNNNQLTNGAGYITAAAVFPSGTKMLFQQTSAPTGWTKVTSGVNNKALRVVSGSAGSGGNVAFTTVFASRGLTANSGNATAGGNISVANTTAGGNVSISNVSTSGTVNSHTLSTNEMPSHYHNINGNKHGNYYGWEANHSGIYGLNNRSYDNQGTNYRTSTNAGRVESTGGGGGHSHGFTGSSHTHNGSLSGTAHNHNATFSGSAHNHSITVSNLDMQAEYLDVIIAEKD